LAKNKYTTKKFSVTRNYTFTQVRVAWWWRWRWLWRWRVAGAAAAAVAVAVVGRLHVPLKFTNIFTTASKSAELFSEYPNWKKEVALYSEPPCTRVYTLFINIGYLFWNIL
jgi:hypothetical protein